ncbi:P-loop containing nucleoside triphosphate hydrolase protein, partial [Fistulina hepatica ATCC 64428]
MNNSAQLNFLRSTRSYAQGQALKHETTTAPVVTIGALRSSSDSFPDSALLGFVKEEIHEPGDDVEEDGRIFMNTGTPMSTILCGVQGAGKSHTLSCILESALIKDDRIGTQSHALAALAFHFDREYVDRPCEAAHLAVPSAPGEPCVQKVTVLVSRSNLSRMKRIYGSIPGVTVFPLQLRESHLNAERMKVMMGLENVEALPLYMYQVRSIMREMVTASGGYFNYSVFKQRVAAANFTPIQRQMLGLRFTVLDSYISNGKQEDAPDIESHFAQGALVIVDLTDPFVDDKDAGLMFNMILSLFVEWKTQAGKIAVLDEAHKYLTNDDAACLNRTLNSLIRQQRHLGIRVVISTQEPTVIPPSIFDLTDVVIAHRFSSPAWVKHVAQHVSIDNGSSASRVGIPWHETVMTLPTGSALLFAPKGLVSSAEVSFAPSSAARQSIIRHLGTDFLQVYIRQRITQDGGASIMA